MGEKDLIRKIEKGEAIIGIIGQGYVGLPLAMTFAKKFKVIGYDVNEQIIKNLNEGKSHVLDVKDEMLKKYLKKSFFPTSNQNDLKSADFIIICVPTPLTPDKQPDLSFVKNACESVSRILSKGQFVILESTTYPTTTEDVVIPILEKSGLKAGVDFCVAFSPERVDPGNKKYTIENTPKVVGGINEKCTDVAATLYGSVILKVIKVKDTRTAEAVKMVENIFRDVNIALINEMALIFEKMGINIWEVIDAAATKPYGFMPFYPGPGVGGHCIPLDPLYMSYIAKRYGFVPRFIETASEINEFMKIHVVNLIEMGLRHGNRNIRDSSIAIMGLAYKKDIDDTRESPAIKIIEELVNIGAAVKVYDPYIRSIKTKVGEFFSEKDIESAFKSTDCAVFLVDHDLFKKYNIKKVVKLMRTPVIVDCKNIFEMEYMRSENVIYLAIGKSNNIKDQKSC